MENRAWGKEEMRKGGQEDMITVGQGDKGTGWQDRWDNSLADLYSS